MVCKLVILLPSLDYSDIKNVSFNVMLSLIVLVHTEIFVIVTFKYIRLVEGML